jgi:hypothetical protein
MADRPTSDAEIRAACPGLSTWLYRDLAELEERGEFPELPIAVLYETEAPGFGHWVGLLHAGDGIVEHFDPYGLHPDAELKWVPKKYRRAFAADAPHMVRLLARIDEAGAGVGYSEFRLQSRRPDIATCGRWVALRCRNPHLSAAQFARAVRREARARGLSPDELTVRLVPMPDDPQRRITTAFSVT